MPLFGQENLVRFFIHREVARLGHTLARTWIGFPFLARQLWSNLVDGQIHLGVVVGLSANDERRARLIDEDGVHLVDDGKVQLALHTVTCVVHHVVAQIVKAVFVVRAVRHISKVSQLFFFTRRLWQVHPHRHSQEVVQRAHGLSVAFGQVIVDRHDVYALAAQCVEVHRQRRGQGFTLTSAHFSNFPLVQRDTAHKLHIKMAHPEHALGGFAHHGKSLGQKIVQFLPLGQTILKFLGFAAQRLIRQLFQCSFHGIDARNSFAVLLQQPVVAAAKEGSEKFNHAR